MDEYLGMEASHPASFRRYLHEKIVDFIHPENFFGIEGDTLNIEAELARYESLLQDYRPVACVLGIGENGHLAFNDPPADFETDEPYIIVELDERCRGQQLGEGWFETLEDVPGRAISMSIKQILKSACLIVTVPDARKAEAVKNALEGEVTPTCPASILQHHGNCRLFLDAEAASLLGP